MAPTGDESFEVNDRDILAHHNPEVSENSSRRELFTSGDSDTDLSQACCKQVELILLAVRQQSQTISFLPDQIWRAPHNNLWSYLKFGEQRPARQIICQIYPKEDPEKCLKNEMNWKRQFNQKFPQSGTKVPLKGT